MLDYNFLRPPCMLAPYPKGFFIGTWEDYRGGVPLAGPTYLSFICDGWSIKSRPGTFSLPTAARRSPLWVSAVVEREPGSHHHSFISFLSAKKMRLTPKNCECNAREQKKRATAWFTTTSTQTNKNIEFKSRCVWLAIKRFRKKSFLKEMVKNTFPG